MEKLIEITQLNIDFNCWSQPFCFFLLGFACAVFFIFSCRTFYGIIKNKSWMNLPVKIITASLIIFYPLTFLNLVFKVTGWDYFHFPLISLAQSIALNIFTLSLFFGIYFSENKKNYIKAIFFVFLFGIALFFPVTAFITGFSFLSASLFFSLFIFIFCLAFAVINHGEKKLCRLFLSAAGVIFISAASFFLSFVELQIVFRLIPVLFVFAGWKLLKYD